MLIKLGDFEYTEVWDGILYKKLSHYPEATDWEIQNLIDFIDYENMYHRESELQAEDTIVLEAVKQKIRQHRNMMNRERVRVPEKITECTACPVRKGCETKFVCHTSPIENAIKILQGGSLLSAVKARKLPAAVLKQEGANAAGDPEDYFDYIMFSWGNCQAGDRLVMERKQKRFPTDRDLSIDFTPGVRFYFQYDVLINHPNRIFDGVLPFKVKDELVLSDWVYAIIVPLREKKRVEGYIPHNLLDKVHYIENDCKDIWDWSEKVYQFIECL